MKTNIIIPKISEDHNDSFWYDGQVATFEKDGKILSVEATGSIRIYVDMQGKFEDSDRLDDKEAVEFCKKCNMDDNNINNDDLVHFDMNNWFAVRELDAEGNVVGDDFGIYGHYDQAVEVAETLTKA